MLKKTFRAGGEALVAPRKSYNQNCPIATGLDVLGERWTLLILRELLTGPGRAARRAAAAVPFSPIKAAGLRAAYHVEIDSRRFEFAVDQGHLTTARGEPDVTVTACAADLATARLGSTEAKCTAAPQRIKFDGGPDAIESLRTVFSLPTK